MYTSFNLISVEDPTIQERSAYTDPSRIKAVELCANDKVHPMEYVKDTTANRRSIVLAVLAKYTWNPPVILNITYKYGGARVLSGVHA